MCVNVCKMINGKFVLCMQTYLYNVCINSVKLRVNPTHVQLLVLNICKYFIKAIHTIHCIMYIVQCTSYIVHCVYCTMCCIQCTVYTVLVTVYIEHCIP